VAQNDTACMVHLKMYGLYSALERVLFLIVYSLFIGAFRVITIYFGFYMKLALLKKIFYYLNFKFCYDFIPYGLINIQILWLGK